MYLEITPKIKLNAKNIRYRERGKFWIWKMVMINAEIPRPSRLAFNRFTSSELPR
jgi:hypothetical protein